MNGPAAAGVQRRVTALVFFAAVAVALISAKPHAGAWYDGSRLATVESLVDYGTWSIDDSIFVNPARVEPGRPPPFAPGEAALLAHGTSDKLFINGRFYSDKSPVPGLFMAGVYAALQWTTGLVAREHPDRFCYLLTLFSSGIAYVISVCCIDRCGIAFATATRLLLTSSFALATIALPYARQVNNHIVLLAVCSALVLVLAPRTRAQLMAVGTLCGIGYTIDLGIGPVLVITTTALVAYRTRSASAVILMLLAAFPWFALHHYLNYQIGGTFSPANAHAAYLVWPGSPFDPAEVTGHWVHKSIVHFFGYGLDLLFGKRGFFGHNLALYLAAAGAVLLLRRPVAETPEIIWACCLFVGGWLIYSITSTNHAGSGIAVRWFVPLLAPGYYVVARLMRHAPEHRGDLVVLTAFGSVLGAVMWWQGPWAPRTMPGFWFIQAGALVTWLIYRRPLRKS